MQRSPGRKSERGENIRPNIAKLESLEASPDEDEADRRPTRDQTLPALFLIHFEMELVGWRDAGGQFNILSVGPRFVQSVKLKRSYDMCIVQTAENNNCTVSSKNRPEN